MVGVYNIKIDKNMVFKYINSQNEVGNKLTKRFKNKQHYAKFINIIQTSYKYNIIGQYIVKGFIINNANYKSPLVRGPTLNNLNLIYQLSTIEKILIIYTIGELISCLIKFKNTYKYLSGDWMPHNIVWDVDNHTLINVDLEGFYTYSPFGLQLSWKGHECDIKYIKKRLFLIMRKIWYNIYNNTVITTNKYMKVISVLNIPSCYQLWFPFNIYDMDLNNNYNKRLTEISKNVNVITADIITDCISFKTFAYIKFSNNIPYMISSATYKNDDNYYFKFISGISHIEISAKQKPSRNIIINCISDLI